MFVGGIQYPSIVSLIIGSRPYKVAVIEFEHDRPMSPAHIFTLRLGHVSDRLDPAAD
jgi:hypothetical protein